MATSGLEALADVMPTRQSQKDGACTRPQDINMVAQEFLSQLDKLHFVDSVGLDDFADRCSYMLSFVLLVICFAIVTLKSYVFEPLSCYTATTFSGSNMVAYINAFCWVNGTVPADVDTDRLDDSSYWLELEGKKLNYYQWVSLVLALQAILCYLPRLAWEVITFNRVGTNLGFLIESAQSASGETGATRTKHVQFVATSIDTLLFARRRLKQHRPRASQMRRALEFLAELLPRKRLGRALCTYYMLVKLAYLTNSVGQLILMDRFLGMNSSNRLFGISILHDLLNGRHWQETLIFPRVGYCRVPIKLVSTPVPTLVAQCTLPVNMLNEKVYIFLWYWFVFVSTMEVISIVIWIGRLAARRKRVSTLVHYLKVADAYTPAMQKTLDRFEVSFLRPDGTFLLHMLRLNAGEIITHEILQALLDRYIQHERMVNSKQQSEMHEGPVFTSSPSDQTSAGKPAERLADECALKQRLA
nr:unnamed protein product [Spirometra erinaceieuropaei]